MTDFPSSPVSATLKPCPFCGLSDLVMSDQSPSQWRAILCNECGARGPSVKLEDREIENDWNTRTSGHAQTPAEQERIAELQYEAGMYKSLYENAIARSDTSTICESASRVPKVRTSHHRNKEEADRLQAIVDERCK